MDDAERRYALLKQLAGSIPDFGQPGTPLRSEEALKWLAKLHAVLEPSEFGISNIHVSVASDNLGGTLHNQNVSMILGCLHRAIAKMELILPGVDQGSFVAAGNEFDALASTGNIVSVAHSEVMFIDPYLGPKVLAKFAIQAPEGVRIVLLAAQGRVKPGLVPAANAWAAQYGPKRPLTLRLAPTRDLHDRLIVVDRKDCWDVSQSFENLAERSPATIAKALGDSATLKLEAYLDILDKADLII